MNSSKVPYATRVQIKHLYDAEVPLRDIAERCGVSVRNASHIAIRMGCAKRRPKFVKGISSVRLRAAYMVQNGMKYSEVADLLGVSRNVVAGAVRDAKDTLQSTA